MNSSEPKPIKVCLLGSSGVGKSSILKRFVLNDFEEHEPTTLGAAFQDKKFDYKGITYKFQIWDTAGQEKYAPLAHMYYRDSKIAILIYDITNADSFATLKDWNRELNEKGPKNLILCVIGNKSDLEDQAAVDSSTARAYAKSINATFKLTSAKENRGITELFTKLCEEIEKKELDMMTSQKRGDTLSQKPKNIDSDSPGGCSC
mmetsp:Transcript_10120/g.11497  ORF Transcript_10120/g.11497 Transcript_10120/m.11497 type:complete len:204 (+) Transcript_10120:29-640(+)